MKGFLGCISKNRRGGSNDMYDTARRVALVKQRVRENTRRRQRREAISLSAACMLLCAALMQTAGTVVGPGQPEAWGVFGAMLLREDAGGYVLVAVVSFAAAAAITPAGCWARPSHSTPSIICSSPTAARRSISPTPCRCCWWRQEGYPFSDYHGSNNRISTP